MLGSDGSVGKTWVDITINRKTIDESSRFIFVGAKALGGSGGSHNVNAVSDLNLIGETGCLLSITKNNSPLSKVSIGGAMDPGITTQDNCIGMADTGSSPRTNDAAIITANTRTYGTN